MDEIKLSDDVIEQIKDFKHNNLTEEQKLLIDKLVSNEELKTYYKEYGLCNECNQPRRHLEFCNFCLLQNFKNYTSGNYEVDKLIQNSQLKAKAFTEILEWIEYDKFKNVEYLAKGGFGTVFKAMWEVGPIWNYYYDNWQRLKNTKVALKCLHNSQGITAEFLKEVKYFFYSSIIDLHEN
jgi:hypothetical protein